MVATAPTLQYHTPVMAQALEDGERLIRDGNQLARRMQAGEGSGEWESCGAWLETAVEAAPASELKDLGGDL